VLFEERWFVAYDTVCLLDTMLEERAAFLYNLHFTGVLISP